MRQARARSSFAGPRRSATLLSGALAAAVVAALAVSVPARAQDARTIGPTESELRTAIEDRNAGDAPTSVLFNAPGTIGLATSLPAVAKPFTIDATGSAAGLTINAAPAATNVLSVNPGAMESVRVKELNLGSGNVQVTSGTFEWEVEAIDSSFAGAITGAAGSFRKFGAGTLTLTGANAYGGTTTVSAGELRVTEQGVGTLMALPNGNVTVATASTLHLENDSDRSFGAAISGEGEVRKSGLGVLTLTGTGTWTGATTVEAGTLEADAAKFGDTAIEVESGAVLHFAEPGTSMDATTFNSDISGDGTFRKTGDSRLIVESGSIAAAQTEVQAGNLTLRDSPGAGAFDLQAGMRTLELEATTASGPVFAFAGDVTGTGDLKKIGDGAYSFDGNVASGVATSVNAGRLDLIGAADFDGGISVSGGAAIRFAQPADFSFAGAIGGSGDVEKTGTGRLTFANGQNYGGTTTVSAGRLDVNAALASSAVALGSGATLGGTGNLAGAVSSTGATIAPGNSIGTLSVGSLTLDAASTVAIEIDAAGAADQLAVGGAANLANATLRVTLDPAAPTPASPVVLTAGSVNGVFNVPPPSFFLDVTPVYAANQVSLSITDPGRGFVDAAATSGQRSVGAALDAIALTGSATGTLATFLGERVLLPDAAAAASALDAVGGEAFTILPTVQRALAKQMFTTVARRGLARARVARGASVFSDEHFASGVRPGAERAFGVGGVDVWYEGWLQGAELGDHDARDLESLSGGSTLGADFAPIPGVLVGAALGYARSTAELDGVRADFDADTVQAALYAGWHGALARVVGQARYAFTSAELERTIEIGTLDQSARSETDGHEFGIALDASLDLPLGGADSPVHLQPMAGFAWDHLRGEDVSERGAGTLALAAEGDSIDSIVTTLGLRLEGAFELDPDTAIVPWIESAFAHEFGDAERELDVRFAAVPGAAASFRSRGASVPRNTWRAGAGWDVQLFDGLVLSASYDVDLAGGFLEHTGRIGAAYRW